MKRTIFPKGRYLARVRKVPCALGGITCWKLQKNKKGKHTHVHEGAIVNVVGDDVNSPTCDSNYLRLLFLSG